MALIYDNALEPSCNICNKKTLLLLNFRLWRLLAHKSHYVIPAFRVLVERQNMLQYQKDLGRAVS